VLGLPRPSHGTEQAWAAQPTTGLASRRTQLASAHSARSALNALIARAVARLTDGYPIAKLHIADDPSDGAPPGMTWPEAKAVDRPRRGPHDAWQKGGHVKGNDLRLSLHQRRGSELDSGGHPGVHMAQRGAPAHPGYTTMRVRWVALHRGLDGTLSIASAWPAGQAA
jgi:hypothetical protein